MIDLDHARKDAEAISKRKPETLDQEQRLQDERRAAEEQVRKAEEWVRVIRERVQRFVTLGEK